MDTYPLAATRQHVPKGNIVITIQFQYPSCKSISLIREIEMGEGQSLLRGVGDENKLILYKP